MWHITLLIEFLKSKATEIEWTKEKEDRITNVFIKLGQQLRFDLHTANNGDKTDKVISYLGIKLCMLTYIAEIGKNKQLDTLSFDAILDEILTAIILAVKFNCDSGIWIQDCVKPEDIPKYRKKEMELLKLLSHQANYDLQIIKTLLEEHGNESINEGLLTDVQSTGIYQSFNDVVQSAHAVPNDSTSHTIAHNNIDTSQLIKSPPLILGTKTPPSDQRVSNQANDVNASINILSHQSIINRVDRQINKFWWLSLIPFIFASAKAKVQALQALRESLTAAPNKNHSDVINEWKQTTWNTKGNIKVSMSVVIGQHRNRFFSPLRQGKKTTTENFVDSLLVNQR